MVNRDATSVVPLIPNQSAGESTLAPEQPRDFHFAVTWVTLFAHLDLIEATGPRLATPNRASTVALVPVIASPTRAPRDQDTSAAWEMVVPKMIRRGPRSFVPAEGGDTQ